MRRKVNDPKLTQVLELSSQEHWENYNCVVCAHQGRRDPEDIKKNKVKSLETKTTMHEMKRSLMRLKQNRLNAAEKLGVVVHAVILARGSLRQEEHEASLGYLACPCLRKPEQTNKQKPRSKQTKIAVEEENTCELENTAVEIMGNDTPREKGKKERKRRVGETVSKPWDKFKQSNVDHRGEAMTENYWEK
jgi:hypothetical protein